MRYSKRSTLEARRIIRQGNATSLFGSITEHGWIEVRWSSITNNMANYLSTADAE